MIEFRDALTDLLEEFGTEDGGFKGELPEGRHMRVDNKNFYFDIGQNNRGVYMRISEVRIFICLNSGGNPVNLYQIIPFEKLFFVTTRELFHH